MTVSTIISAIADGIAILKDAPAALKVAREFGITLGFVEQLAHQQPLKPKIDENEPIFILTKGLKDEITDLTKQYHFKRDTWDQIETERQRARIAAKLCDLLVTGEDVLKEAIKGFDTLKKFFCRVSSELQKA